MRGCCPHITSISCRHTVSPYVAEFHSDNDIQSELRKWSSFDPNRDTRSSAQVHAYDHEQAIRRQANAEKKQYANYQMVFGDRAPKTLGAFRRMKRQNTAKFQTLQQEYRSIMQTKSTVRMMSHVPGYEKAVLPDAKFDHYILDKTSKGKEKAETFNRVLGYNLSNKMELIENIKAHLPYTRAKYRGKNSQGDLYEAIMDLKGPNGRTAPVLTAWIDDKVKKETRLTSAYVIDKKKAKRKRGKG